MAGTSIQDILAKYQTIDNQPTSPTQPSGKQSPQDIFNSLAANERQRPAHQVREETEAQRFREEQERRARLEEEKRVREAEEAAERERQRREEETAAERERRRQEEEAAERERQRQEEEAERERLRVEEAKRLEEEKHTQEERKQQEQADLSPIALPDLDGDDANFLSSPDQWSVPVSDDDTALDFGSNNMDVNTPVNLSSLNENAQDLLEDPEYYLEDFFNENIADYINKDPDNFLLENFNENIGKYVTDSLSPAIEEFVDNRLEVGDDTYRDVAPVNPNFLISVPAAALFFPAGMFATYYSALSLQRSLSGDGDGAQRDADMARNIGIVGIVVGAILWTVILTYVFAPNVIESVLRSIGLM